MATWKLMRRLRKKDYVICQSWSQICPKRYLQTTTGYQCSTESTPDKQLTAKEQEAADEQTVLHFFNNCDYITLKKFIGRYTYFRQIVPDEILRRGVLSRRFKNIGDVRINMHGFKRDNSVEVAADSINQLKELEENTLGIRQLDPQLTYEDVKDIEQVTAVEVFQNEIAYAVENRDRRIVEVGHTVLFPQFKYAYEHVSYQDRIGEVISKIPESPIYLMSPPVTGKGQKFQSHQAIVLSMSLLCLNMKPARNVVGDPRCLHPAGGDISNKVHLMKQSALQEYYEIMFRHELLHHAFDFNHWLDARSRPLAGMQWDNETKHKLTKAPGRQQMTKCVFIADMFFKALYKKRDNFPRMYSAKIL